MATKHLTSATEKWNGECIILPVVLVDHNETVLLRYDTDFGGSKPFGHGMKIHNSVIWLNWLMFDSKIIIQVKIGV